MTEETEEKIEPNELENLLEIMENLPEKEKAEFDLLLLGEKREKLWQPLIDISNPTQPTPQKLAADCQADILLYGGAAYGGKLLCIYTKLVTPSGFTEMGDIKVGNFVIAQDGTPTKVKFISEIETPEDSYEVEFSTGEKIKACGRHQWVTLTNAEREQQLKLTPEYRAKRRASRSSRAVIDSKKPWASEGLTQRNRDKVYEYKNSSMLGSVKTTEEILKTLKVRGSRDNHVVVNCEPVKGFFRTPTVEPYLLGVWLADGTSATGAVGMMTKDLDEILNERQWDLVSEKIKTEGRKEPYKTVVVKYLTKSLRSLDLIKNKHIPEQYFLASLDQKIELLQGLMDTDGTCDKKGKCEIGFSNKVLAENVFRLISSLGIKTSLKENKLLNKKAKKHFRMQFKTSIPVFQLRRKSKNQTLEGHHSRINRRSIVSVKKIKPVPMRCIQVEHESGTYLITESHIVTHNTNLICGLSVTQHNRVSIFRRMKEDLIPIEEEIISIRGRHGYNGQKHRFYVPKENLNIRLGGMQYEKNKQSYKGDARDLMCFDEVRDFSRTQFTFVIGWNRSPDPNQRCRVIATTNPPDSAEGDWIVEFWAPWLDPNHPNPAMPGELRYFVTDENGDDKELDGPDPIMMEIAGVDQLVYPKSRTFIPSSIDDNPYASVSYKATLQSLPEPLRSQMLMGDFMAGRDDDAWQVIPSAWVQAAQDRWTEQKPVGEKMSAMGVDAAMGGKDKYVLAPRYGSYFGELVRKSGREVPTGALGSAFVMQHIRHGASINLDIIGSAGAATYEHLSSNGSNVFPVDNRKSTAEKEKNGLLGFSNVRSMNFWRLREALDPDGDELISLPPGSQVKADLCAPRWRRVPRGGYVHGVIEVEGKDTELKDGWGDLRKRLGRSTDDGDAVVNAWARGKDTVSKQRSRSRLPDRANNRRP